MDCKDLLTHKMQRYNEYILSASNKINEMIGNIQHLIGNNDRWCGMGLYKEILLQEILRIFLPEQYGVGTGFVIYDNKISSQIDVIVYDKIKAKKSANFLKYGAFVILDSNSVMGIIEVKSTYYFSRCPIDKILSTKLDIGENIFAGIFAFNNTRINTALVEKTFHNIDSSLDCVSFGKKYCVCNCKYDLPNQNVATNRISYYDFYRLEQNLSFGYFILTLLKFLKVKV